MDYSTSVSGIQFGKATALIGAECSYRQLVTYFLTHVHYKDLPTLNQYKCQRGNTNDAQGKETCETGSN